MEQHQLVSQYAGGDVGIITKRHIQAYHAKTMQTRWCGLRIVKGIRNCSLISSPSVPPHNIWNCGLSPHWWRTRAITSTTCASSVSVSYACRRTDEVLRTLTPVPWAGWRCLIAVRSSSFTLRPALVRTHWISINPRTFGVMVVGWIHKQRIASIKWGEIVNLPIDFL